MKTIVSTFILAAAGISAVGQQSTAPAVKADAEVKARVVAELAAAASFHGQVKDSPLQADEVNESVQTLSDGNRIVRSSTGKFYRNSAGRVRRESSGGVGGVLGTTFFTGQGVSIVNPSMGEKYLLDEKLKTARVLELAQQGKGLTIAGQGTILTPDAKREHELMARDLRDKIAVARPIEPGRILEMPVPPTPPVAVIAPQPGFGFTYSVGSQNSKYETRTEELGVRDFEGVSAEGTRRTTIIPEGAIGNERPIEIVYERWYSKELGLVVYSRNTDPRFGEQTYRLTNIIRAEPDPSLFSVPSGYKKVSQDGSLYRLTTPAPSKKATSAAKVVNVSSTKKN